MDYAFQVSSTKDSPPCIYLSVAHLSHPPKQTQPTIIHSIKNHRRRKKPMYPFSHLFSTLPPTAFLYPVIPGPNNGVYEFSHGMYAVLARARANTTTFSTDGVSYHISAVRDDDSATHITETPAENDFALLLSAGAVAVIFIMAAFVLWGCYMGFRWTCRKEFLRGREMGRLLRAIEEDRVRMEVERRVRKEVEREVRMAGASKDEDKQGAKEEEMERDQGWCSIEANGDTEVPLV